MVSSSDRGGVLSDWEIVQALLNGDIIITPLMNGKEQIGGSAVDLRLGTEFKLIRIVKQTHFDLSVAEEQIKDQVQEYTEIVHVAPMQPFILHPDEFALGSTLEYIVLPDNIAGRLEGRSTWGRVGLQVHSTAGLVDPGFQGTLTFELHNMGKLPLPLYPGVRIAQISFHRCAPVSEKYVDKASAKYARSTGTKDTMFYEDYEFRQIRKFLQKGP
jgi:dCTP deaminase